MSNNQYYILKYNLKYALNDTSGLYSETDKQQIRQAEKLSGLFTKGFYLYAIGDMIWSVRSTKQAYGHNKHSLLKMKQRLILFLAVRLFFCYEATEYAAMWYLTSQTQNIVRKTHPLKQ